MEAPRKNWFALCTKPRHEFKAAAQLQENEIEFYLPTITTTRRWSDRRKKITEPIFKGYIFAHVNEKERIISLEQPAIIRCVVFEGKPAVIPAWQIESIKKMLEESLDIFVSDKIPKGSKVKVISGPFNGVIGVVTLNPNNGRMLAVSIDMLHRSVLVNLPVESVVKYIEN